VHDRTAAFNCRMRSIMHVFRPQARAVAHLQLGDAEAPETNALLGIQQRGFPEHALQHKQKTTRSHKFDDTTEATQSPFQQIFTCTDQTLVPTEQREQSEERLTAQLCILVTLQSFEPDNRLKAGEGRQRIGLSPGCPACHQCTCPPSRLPSFCYPVAA
jgi:hypothetical protein